MSSIRVPPDLLQDLHEAAPPGVYLPALLRRLLADAGGKDAVHDRILAERRRTAAKAQVARLRAKGHRSVVLDESEQVNLAEASAVRVRRLEREGLRHRFPGTRQLSFSGKGGRPQRVRPRMVRRGL